MEGRAIACWRWVASVLFIGVAVTTHWPRLSFGPEGPSDKFIHAVAFGLLTFAAVQARWATRWPLLFFGMAAFAAVDESTQQLSLFNRHTSLEDYIADLIGVVVACVLCLPRGADQASASARRALWGRPFTWAALATSATAGAIVGAFVGLGLRHFLAPEARIGQVVMLGAIAGAVTLVDGVWRSAVHSCGLRAKRGWELTPLAALAMGTFAALAMAVMESADSRGGDMANLAVAASVAILTGIGARFRRAN